MIRIPQIPAIVNTIVANRAEWVTLIGAPPFRAAGAAQPALTAAPSASHWRLDRSLIYSIRGRGIISVADAPFALRMARGERWTRFPSTRPSQARPARRLPFRLVPHRHRP